MKIQKLIIVVFAVCILSPSSVFAEVFIRQFTDLVKEHQQAEWNHKSGALIDSKSSQLGAVELKSKVFTEGELFGETLEFLQMKAKPVSGQKEFGAQGKFTYDLPEGQYFQFQGFVEIPQANQNPASVMVQVSTLQDGGWKVAQVFKGLESGIIEEENIKYVQFVLDLSKWAGQQVQLELVLNANASYMNVNG